jgi:DNA polymerase-3 subunit epsilon
VREGGTVGDTTVAAIDFETATASRNSACAVGVAIRNDDGTVRGRGWLIRPPGNTYDGFNIMIHGIHPEDTEDASSIVEVWAEVDEYIGNRTLVAHNASFDMSVLRSSFAHRQAPIPHEYEYLCTYRLARSVWPTRYSYRLSDIAEDLGLDTDKHHDPVWDAYAALQVGDALARESGVRTLREAAVSIGYLIGKLHTDPHSWNPFSNAIRTHGTTWKPSDLTPGTEAFDTDHPLYGHRIVITGTLPNGMTRREAYQRVVNVGGEVAANVSRRVNILVIADLDMNVIGEDGKSGKLRKAIELAEAGNPIELMDSRYFLRLLGS